MSRVTQRYPCPCCAYPTLEERDAYEICCLCNWEDDGQDDADADRVKGGPNGTYSLAAARLNFRRYWVMYGAAADTRILGGDNERELAAKQAMARAYDAMGGAEAAEVERLAAIVRSCEEDLASELQAKVAAYERACD